MKELYTAAGIFMVLILLGVWMVQNNRNEQKKKLVQLRKNGEKAGETDGTGKERKTGSVSETKSRGKLLRGRDYLE